MTTAPGPLIGAGREAKVYDIGDGRVLRRYDDPARDTTYEARIMRHVAAHGYPVPEVFEAEGPDMVMERIAGPMMMTQLSKRPWTIPRHTATLARLQAELNRIPVTDWMHDRLLGGPELVHADLHPLNVLLSPAGPVVIDWVGAGRGDHNDVVAYMWLLFATSMPDRKLERIAAFSARWFFLRSFLGHYDRDELRGRLGGVADLRMRDANTYDVERQAIAEFVEREARAD